jgi:Ca2+-transporting ATPase
MPIPHAGLTHVQAVKLLEQHGPNLLPEQKPKSSLQIFLSVIKEPMILLLIVSGLIYLLLGDKIEAILLCTMIGFIAFITFIQEKKTENALAALKKLANPRVTVIRQGQETVIDSSNLVPGDIFKIGEGDRVAADGTIIQTEEVYFDESSITGESLPVQKQVNDVLYSGTLTTSGWAYAKVDHTGIQTKIGQIGASLSNISETPTRMQQEIKKLIYQFALIGLVASLLAFGGLLITTNDVPRAALQGIAIAMSLLPEEFPVVITIFTALGALRIAKKRVLMTNLPTLETLGSATVLCTDKTGTLTQNRMTVTGVTPTNGNLENPYQQKLSTLATQVLNYARYACHRVISDSMEIAIDNAWNTLATTKLPVIDEVSSLKDNGTYMINHIDPGSKNSLYVVKGAPESLFKLCRMSATQQATLDLQVKQLAQTGARVLAIGSSPNNKHFQFLGLISLSDPVRPGVKEAIITCYQAGIRVIMITGDFPDTARSIGESIGLTGTENVLIGKDITQLSPTQLQRRLKAVNICARIMPEQKLAIVEALRKNGDIVAMTGDGVNDAPALKAAHMGVAMGLNGTDVAREAADMILTDDNFVSIVNAIKGGRRIFTNIRKAVGFIIAVHLPIAVAAIIPTFLGWPLILTPVHIVILELLIDPACTLVFETEPAEPSLMQQPPRPPNEKLFNRAVFIRAIYSGLAVSLSVFAAYIFSIKSGLSADLTRTIAFSTLIYGNLGLILSYRANHGSVIKALLTKNRAFWLVTGSISILMFALLTVPALQTLFHFTRPELSHLLIITLFALIAFTLEIAFSKFAAKAHAGSFNRL